MPSIASLKGKGWLKDFPDFRDNTPSTEKLSSRQKARGAKEPVAEVLQRLIKNALLS